MKPRRLRLIICQSVTGSQGTDGSWPGGSGLGVLDQVVAAAEALAVAGQRDDVHVGIEVGLFHAGRQLARHLHGDAVTALGAVERDARDPAGDLVGERLRL